MNHLPLAGLVGVLPLLSTPSLSMCHGFGGRKGREERPICSDLKGFEKYVRPWVVAVLGVWSCVRVCLVRLPMMLRACQSG